MRFTAHFGNRRHKRVWKKKLRNDPRLILEALRPFEKDIEGIVVESIYNWYWLVDLLMDEGYRVHLANPSKIEQYSGLKHGDDEHDAFWLAEMLRLKILPEGFIYPKAQRPLRDLLRKRGHLVRLRTSLMVSLQNILAWNIVDTDTVTIRHSIPMTTSFSEPTVPTYPSGNSNVPGYLLCGRSMYPSNRCLIQNERCPCG